MTSIRGASLRSQTVILKRSEHMKYLPYAFTEQGVATLSSVLRSPRLIAEDESRKARPRRSIGFLP